MCFRHGINALLIWCALWTFSIGVQCRSMIKGWAKERNRRCVVNARLMKDKRNARWCHSLIKGWVKWRTRRCAVDVKFTTYAGDIELKWSVTLPTGMWEEGVSDLLLIQGCEISSDTDHMWSLMSVDCNRVDVKANCNRDEIVFLCKCNNLHVDIIIEKNQPIMRALMWWS